MLTWRDMNAAVIQVKSINVVVRLLAWLRQLNSVGCVIQAPNRAPLGTHFTATMPRRGRPSVVSSASRRGTRVRDFEPVLSEDGSSVGRGSVSGRSRTSSFRHGRRRKGRAHKDNAGILTDNWKPPPKRVVKVAPATIKNFYSMMPDEKQHNSETAFADRGEGARRGTRGMFLATPGYEYVPD